MDEKLILGIYKGTVDVDKLTDEQQAQVLSEYQLLAENWIESPKPELQQLAKEILLLLEQSSLSDDNDGETLH